MAIQIFHDYEVGQGLEFKDGKTHVKPDNSGNVQLEVSDKGLKGNVEFPAAFDPSALEAKDQELQTAIDEAKAEAEKLEQRVKAVEDREDIKLAGAEVDGTNLKLTTSDGVEITVDLVKFVDAIPTAAEIYAEIKDEIIADVKAALKGEEVQDFNGVTKGYLIEIEDEE